MAKPRRVPYNAQYHPGNKSKSAAGEISLIRQYLRTDVKAESIVTATILSHLFDLVDCEAKLAIEMLLQEGYLVRSTEFGGVPVRAVFLPKSQAT